MKMISTLASTGRNAERDPFHLHCKRLTISLFLVSPLSSSTPNILETLSYLRSLGKHVAFITNNATSSRQTYHEKFSRLGIETSLSEIFTCGSATASYLRDEIIPRREKTGQKNGIYLIGQSAMEEEFKECGLNWNGGTVRTPPLSFSPISFSLNLD